MADARPEEIVGGSVTSTPGFEAAGVACGLKPTGALDLALVHSPRPCVAAAVFTRNAFQAAPVLYDRRILGENPAAMRGVVINSGCANACTGERGLRDAEAMAAHAAELLGAPPQAVAVMSTGVIGAYLPLDRIRAGIRQAVGALSPDVGAGHDAARAIMTTDTRPKEVAVRVELAGRPVTIAGMAKGAGMISPNMATLLCVLTTDAVVSLNPARRALRDAVDAGFNLITVDGDTSTNDTALLLANGASGVRIGSTADGVYGAYARAVEHVVVELAKALARDGEGAAHLIAITVQGARSRDEARQVAMTIAKSPLVKTAIYGGDANWGRIACAAGYSGVEIDPGAVRIWLGDLEVFRRGKPVPLDEGRAAQVLAREEVPVRLDLGAGDARVTAWTCDLTHGYVDINAHYRS